MLPQWVRGFLYARLRLRYLSNGGYASSDVQWRFRWALFHSGWSPYFGSLVPVTVLRDGAGYPTQ
eukprot:6151179-Pyramimonas_sp.AAC.1